jgi:CSLREA domain-containing protein
MRNFLKTGLLVGLTLGLATAAHAATVNVTTVVDEADASCADGDCSLRDAVSSALAGDTVSIPAGTYVLTLGEIPIDQNLTLTGAGARSTVIDGNAASRVFLVGSANQSAIVGISDLTVRNGLVTDPDRGGGILNRSALTLTRCTVANNRAFEGGGIGSLGQGSLVIQESAVVGNQGDRSGGGIYSSSLGSLTLVNSTVSGNTAPLTGGGVLVSAIDSNSVATLTAINSTIASNTTDPDAGGLFLALAVGNLVNTIVSGNTGFNCDMFESALNSDHSLDSDGSCFFPGPGDLSEVDPLLGPLADSGGPTDTHALLAGSPAIDAGSSANCSAIDQRGVTRPQGPGCDIGAFEVEVASNAPPNCSGAAPSVAKLWPPNHKMVPVSVLGVTDPDGDPVSLEITQVRQDEPTNGSGDGNTCPDAQGFGTATTSVRAERSGQGNGRVYTLSFTASDEQGATCQGSVKVCVPHSSNGTCVDNGPLFDSTVCGGKSAQSASSTHTHKSDSKVLGLLCGSHFPTLQCDLECDAGILLCD